MTRLHTASSRPSGTALTPRRLLRAIGKDELLRDGSMLALAAIATSGLMFVFHIYLARTLRPEPYGVAAALLGVFAIASQLGNAMQLTLARNVAALMAQGNLAAVRTTVSSSVRLSLVGAVALFLVFLAFTPALAAFLHIGSRTAVALLGISASVYLVLSTSRGGLQGLQRFRSLVVSRLGEKVVFMAAGAGLILAGWSVNGVMAALALGVGAMIALAVFDLGPHYGRSGWSIRWRDTAIPGLPLLVTVVGIAALSNLDVVIATNLLAPDDAGRYNALGRVGKVLFFAVLAFNRALFPKSTGLRAAGRPTAHLLWRGFGYVGAVTFVSVALAVPFGRIAFEFTLGPEYVAVAGLLPWYLLAMGLLSLSTVLMYYNLSLSSNRHILPLLAAVVSQLSLVAIRPDRPFEIIVALMVQFSALLAVNAALYVLARPDRIRLAAPPLAGH